MARVVRPLPGPVAEVRLWGTLGRETETDCRATKQLGMFTVVATRVPFRSCDGLRDITRIIRVSAVTLIDRASRIILCVGNCEHNLPGCALSHT